MVAPQPAREGRSTRVLVSIAIVLLVAVDAAYLALIYSQADRSPDVLTPPFVASYLALAVVLIGASLIDAPLLVTLRPAFRAWCGAGLLVLGVLALFSIGLPVVVAAGMATAATVLTLVSRWSVAGLASAVTAAVLAVAVLIVGFTFSWGYIVCPPTGESGGTTPGLFNTGSTYECRDGRLTKSP